MFNRSLDQLVMLIIVTIVSVSACQSQDRNIQITEKLVVTKTPTTTPTPTPTPTKTSSPTQTPLPTSSATPTYTYTPLPSPTITPTPTDTSTPTSTPVVCRKNAQGEFAGVWQTYKNQLGCPIQETPVPNSRITFVEQPFSNGHMFYFGSGDVKFVIVKFGVGMSGYWQNFNDKWDGRNDNHCMEAQEIQPRIVRGFNLIWCTYPEIRNPLGRPLDIEKDFDLELAQGFENGFIIRDSDGFTNNLVYIFYNHGTYERVRYK